MPDLNQFLQLLIGLKITQQKLICVYCDLLWKCAVTLDTFLASKSFTLYGLPGYVANLMLDLSEVEYGKVV